MAEEITDTAANSSRGPQPSGRQEQWCAVCEISVPRGYLKCPKCKQRMPAARRKAAAGGTSVAVVAGARRPFWLLLILGIAGAAAIYFHFVITDTYNTRIRRPRAEAVTYDGGLEGDASNAEDAGPPASAEHRDEAIANLTEALAAAGIDAQVEVKADTPDALVIRCNACAAPALAETISAAESDLAAADFSGVKCFAPNGTVLFRKSW